MSRQEGPLTQRIQTRKFAALQSAAQQVFDNVASGRVVNAGAGLFEGRVREYAFAQVIAQRATQPGKRG